MSCCLWCRSAVEDLVLYHFAHRWKIWVWPWGPLVLFHLARLINCIWVLVVLHHELVLRHPSPLQNCSLQNLPWRSFNLFWAVIFSSWHILAFCAVGAMTFRRHLLQFRSASPTTPFSFPLRNALAINPATFLHDGTLQKLQPNLSRWTRVHWSAPQSTEEHRRAPREHRRALQIQFHCGIVFWNCSWDYFVSFFTECLHELFHLSFKTQHSHAKSRLPCDRLKSHCQYRQAKLSDAPTSSFPNTKIDKSHKCNELSWVLATVT